MDNIFARHRLMMEMTRAGVRALGLPLLTEDAAASPTVTAVRGEEALMPPLFRKNCAGSAWWWPAVSNS